MYLSMYVDEKLIKRTRIQYVGITSYKAKEQYHQLLAKEMLNQYPTYRNATFFVEGVQSKMNSMSMKEIEKMIA